MGGHRGGRIRACRRSHGGVLRLGGAGEAANAAPATTALAAQQGDSVTLSTQRFAALLETAVHGRAQDRTRAASRGHAATGTQAQTHAHAATRTQRTTRVMPRMDSYHKGTHSGTYDAGTQSGGLSVGHD